MKDNLSTTSYVLIFRLNAIDLCHHQSQLLHHSLDCSPALPRCNLEDHVMIIGSILAVTLARSVGVGGLTVEQLFKVAWRQAGRRPSHLVVSLHVLYHLYLMRYQDSRTRRKAEKRAAKVGGIRPQHARDFKVFPGVARRIL